jgi:hypothetical protein
MKLRLTYFLLIFAFFLVGCGVGEPSPTMTDTETASLTPSPQDTLTPISPEVTATATITVTPSPTPPYPLEGVGPDQFPENINPLTGQYVSDPEVLERRPVAVKVNIVPRLGTRPPWGLSFADIVYEFYQNVGYTRFHAIFLGKDAPLAGPIRSARMFDGPLVNMYQTIFAYAGADAIIDRTLREAPFGYRVLREIGERSACPPTDEQPMCRIEPDSFDFLLTGTREIHQYAQERGIDDVAQDLHGLFFHLDAPGGGLPANQITTRISIDSYNQWQYDPDTGRYLRFQDDVLLSGDQEEEFVPLLDRVNEQQIAAENVVILFVTHHYFREPPGEIIEILLEGKGKAYAFRDGLAYEVEWNHPVADQILYLTMENGERYPLKPGVTFYQIIGQFSEVTQPEEDSWRFRFVFP